MKKENLVKKILKMWVSLLRPSNVKVAYLAVSRVVSFVILLFVYLAYALITKAVCSRVFPERVRSLVLAPAKKVYDKVVYINRYKDYTINRVSLIEMALKNMRFKVTRTLITIGGVSVGIAAIVFLVSLGYGIENMVTARVARLGELSQADVFTQPGSNLKIDDASISDLRNLSETKMVLPLIALVGKVNYNGSVTDMAAYGVTTEYLEQSAIRPIKGSTYQSNNITNNPTARQRQEDILNRIENQENPTEGSVAGVTSIRKPTLYSEIREVEFTIVPDVWIEVLSAPLEGGKLLGYTKRVEGQQTGTELWGETYPGSAEYDGDSQEFGRWMKSKVFLWDRTGDSYQEKKGIGDYQAQYEGYIKSQELTGIRSTRVIGQADVLGVSIQQNSQDAKAGEVLQSSVETNPTASLTNVSSAPLSALNSENPQEGPEITEVEDGWVVIEGEGLEEAREEVQLVELPEGAVKEAVANRAMLQLLGIKEESAVGQEFEVSFIVTSALLAPGEDKKESVFTKYKIVGVIPQDDTPYFYVPFYDLRGLGVQNYSQLKIVANNEDDLPEVRKKIEALGYTTTSVADTVSEINSLFSVLRNLLALIGTVALVVASLGMFNTLTVSLLERTREIGLMKALGMKSNEVEELFLTESMVMGLFGGMLGIFLGFVAGKLLGLVLSVVAVAKGVGFVDVSSIPPAFVVLIVGLSLFVGLITGIYPARRATKISALNALRYE